MKLKQLQSNKYRSRNKQVKALRSAFPNSIGGRGSSNSSTSLVNMAVGCQTHKNLFYDVQSRRLDTSTRDRKSQPKQRRNILKTNADLGEPDSEAHQIEGPSQNPSLLSSLDSFF